MRHGRTDDRRWTNCDFMSSAIQLSRAKKRYSFHESQLNLFKLLLKFCLQYFHKVTFSDFWNFVFLNYMKLWHLIWGGKWEIIKCGISWKWLAVERNWWKLGTRGNPYVGYFSGQVIWVQFGVIRCTFAKFPMLRFSKGYFSPSFHRKFMEIIANTGHYFSAYLPKLKTIWHFEDTCKLPRLHCQYP